MRRHFLELGRDILSYGVMAGLSSLTGVLLLPIFTRVFATDQYGALDILVTLSTLLGVFSRLGLPSALARYFHEPVDDAERGALLSTLAGVVAISGLAVFGVAFLTSSWVAGTLLDDAALGPLVVVAVLGSAIDAVGSVPLMALRMQRRIVAFNTLNMLHAATYAAGALILVLVLGHGIEGVLWGAVLGALVQSLGAFACNRGVLRRPSRALLRRSLRYGLPIMPSVVMGWVNRQADRYVLLTFVGLGAVGVYGAAARVGNAVILLTSFFRKAWQPYAMSLLKEPPEVRNEFFRRVLNLYLVGFSVGAVCVVAVSRELFAALVGPEYATGYVVLPWLMAAGVLYVAGEIAAMGVLINERTGFMPLAAWTGAAVNVGLALLLIPRFGIAGAAVGHFVAGLVYLAILWRYSVRESQASLGARRLLPLLVYYVVACLLLLHVPEHVSDPVWSRVARLGVATGFAALALTHCADPKTRRSLLGAVSRLPARIGSRSRAREADS